MIKDTFISNDMNKVYFSYNWQFLLFSITHGVRSFCADRKNQRALRMDAFLTAYEADGFWVLRNDRASERNASLLAKFQSECSRWWAKPTCYHAQTVLTLIQKPLTPSA